MASSLRGDTADRLRLNENLLATSGQWFKNARLAAAERVESQGLPQRRDEYWGYTQPDAFLQKKIDFDVDLNSPLELFSNELSEVINYKNGILQEKKLILT